MTFSDKDQDINDCRVECCQEALETYCDALDVTVSIVSFLIDARHWCDKYGESFAEFDRVAYQHYLTELSAEGRERS